jgi:hypothetical protein
MALREEKKHEQEEQKHSTRSDDKGKIRVRLIPIPLRIFFVLIFILLSTAIGAVIGYSVLGNGNVIEVFVPSTWTHIIDLVEKEM